MAKERTLSEAIDTLATDKATENCRRSVEAAMKAMEPFWKDGSHDYIKKCLINRINSGACWLTAPTPEAINGERAAILNELLNKLPLVAELAVLNSEMQDA